MAYLGYKLVGTDSLDVEPPQSENYETHKALLGQNIAVLEGLDLSGVANGEYF